ncbi:MAG TPA: cytochrome c [Candidatus Binatia bacterium]|nr:cytochrome c [Candidatus Binatia bacterium]
MSLRAIVALAVALVPTLALSAEPRSGAAVYAERCAPCHGDGGAGDGPAAAALEPRPRNFRDASFWNGRTADQLRIVVRDGKPGTMMSPFKDVLSAAEIDAVVAYVGSFRPAAHP